MGRGMMRRLKICFVREVSLADESTRYQENIKLDSKILIAGGGIFFAVRRDPRGRQTSLRSPGGQQAVEDFAMVNAVLRCRSLLTAKVLTKTDM